MTLSVTPTSIGENRNQATGLRVHCTYHLPLSHRYSFKKKIKKLEEHSIEMHNSRQPLSRLTVTLTLTLTFDLIFIGGRGIVMDYLCAKFGDFSFSRFGFS